MARDERRTLLALQQELTEEQFRTLKYLLAERVPAGLLHPASRPDLGELLLQRFPGRALHVVADLLRLVPRLDLVERYGLPGAGEQPPGAAGGSSAAPGRGGEEGSPGEAPLPPPPAARLRPRRLAEKDLLKVARGLGKEWQEVGIACLGLERSRLDQIREDNPGHVVLQIFHMLLEWQRKEQREATASRLRACLAPAALDPGVLDLLQSLEED